jgi:hypothetical protein
MLSARPVRSHPLGLQTTTPWTTKPHRFTHDPAQPPWSIQWKEIRDILPSLYLP